MRRRRNLFLAAAFGLLSILLILVCWSAWGFYHPVPLSFGQVPTPMLWAHRGLHAAAPENSIASVSAAIERGFHGVEVDVHWVRGQGFVVTHNAPTQDSLGPTTLTLDRLLSAIPEIPGFLWVDFKNLPRSDLADAGASLATLVTRYRLEGHVVVESEDPWSLWRFSRHAKCIVPAYCPKKSRNWRDRLRVGFVIGFFRFPSLSFYKKHFTPENARFFRRTALFTWTANTVEELEKAKRNGAQVILTDQDFSKVFPEMYRRVLSDR